MLWQNLGIIFDILCELWHLSRQLQRKDITLPNTPTDHFHVSSYVWMMLKDHLKRWNKAHPQQILSYCNVKLHHREYVWIHGGQFLCSLANAKESQLILPGMGRKWVGLYTGVHWSRASWWVKCILVYHYISVPLTNRNAKHNFLLPSGTIIKQYSITLVNKIKTLTLLNFNPGGQYMIWCTKKEQIINSCL